jgi:hypothetical protein
MMHLARKHIGCEVHAPAGKKREGHHQEAFNEQPLQVPALRRCHMLCRFDTANRMHARYAHHLSG